MDDEKQWLTEFSRTRSDEAFRKLVDANIDLVYSSARRQLRDAPDAHDATQAVFIILAKKARSLPRNVVLAGWLLQTTRYVCRNAIRSATRRQFHEKKAAEMRSEITTPPPEAAFAEFSPLLDEAMSSLATKDRDAVVLRYFQNRQLGDVAVAMGTTPEAARKRVARAVQRLGEFFKDRGISVPAVSIEAALVAGAIQSAPQNIATTITASAAGATAPAAALAKGALFMMTLKTNMAIAAGIAAIFIGTGAAIVVSAKPPAERAAAPARPQPASSLNSAKAEALTQEGWALWQRRQFAQAETRFAAAVKLDPKLTNAWNGLGWSQFNQGNAAAETAFEKVIEMEPDHAAAENALGWIYFNRGQQDKAEEHWLKSDKTPNSSAAWSGLARTYLLQGKWEQAKNYAQKLVDFGDNSAKPLLEAALTQNLPDDLRQQIAPPPAFAGDVQSAWQLLNSGKTTQAVAAFRAAVAKNPQDSNALNGLGWALMRSGKPAEAKKQFEADLAVEPTVGGSINGLAIILKQEGKTDQAIELWKKLDGTADGGTNAGTLFLARTYLEQKQYDKAIPYLQRLAKDNPSDAEIRKGLEEAQAGAGL